MNQPSLYKKANNVQRHDAEQIINAYWHKLQWRLDGCDALLDIGSGCGDVSMDFIYTIMPKNFERIVLSDISPKMISYAKDFYNSHEKCDFKVLDINTEKDLPKDLEGRFDHITSFYCLHWIRNKRQAVRNMFNLLRAEGGDCILMFLLAHPSYDAYELLSKSDKWSTYMKDTDKYNIPLKYASDPKLEFSTQLKEEGFSDIEVEIQQRVYVYEGLESFKDNFKAVNPFLDKIPLYLHDSYMDDLVDIFASFGLKQKHPSKEEDYIFTLPYKIIVAYAKKLANNSQG